MRLWEGRLNSRRLRSRRRGNGNDRDRRGEAGTPRVPCVRESVRPGHVVGTTDRIQRSGFNWGTQTRPLVLQNEGLSPEDGVPRGQASLSLGFSVVHGSSADGSSSLLLPPAGAVLKASVVSAWCDLAQWLRLPRPALILFRKVSRPWRLCRPQTHRGLGLHRAARPEQPNRPAARPRFAGGLRGGPAGEDDTDSLFTFPCKLRRKSQQVLHSYVIFFL